jgi:hypothetical protein
LEQTEVDMAFSERDVRNTYSKRARFYDFTANLYYLILDLKAPAGAGPLLIRLAALMARPFAVTPDLASRHPWRVVETEFSISSFRNLYLGFCYIATGRIGSDAYVMKDIA